MAAVVIGITSGFAGIGQPRHPDQHRDDAVWAADAQEHRPRRGCWHRGQPSCDTRGRACFQLASCVRAGQYRSDDVGLYRARAGCRGVVAGARLAPLISAAHLSRVFAGALSATGVTMLYSSLG